MHNVPYVSDNPFRLLGLPSATLQKDLEHAARKISDRLRKGLRHDVAMSRQWGEEHLGKVAQKVAQMAEDPVLRCLYRLFWPLDRECLTGLPRAEEYDGRHPAQIDFLNMFFFTQSAPDATVIGLMPRRWKAFHGEASSRIRLRRLIHQEQQCGPQAAQEIVNQAWKKAPEFIVEADLGWARTLWEGGKSERACRQLQAVLSTWEASERALDWFIDEADRLALSLNPDSAKRLQMLTGSLAGSVRSDICQDWNESLQELGNRKPRAVQLRPSLDKFTPLLTLLKNHFPQAQTAAVFARGKGEEDLEALAVNSLHLPHNALPPVSPQMALLGKALELRRAFHCEDSRAYEITNFLPERSILVVPLVLEESGIEVCLYLGGPEKVFKEGDLESIQKLLPEARQHLRIEPALRQPFTRLELPAELTRVLKFRSRLLSLAPDEPLPEEVSLTYGLVLSGALSQGSDSQKLGPGDEFGLDQLLDGLNRPTERKAISPTQIQWLARDDFEMTERRFPELESLLRRQYYPSSDSSSGSRPGEPPPISKITL